jgi:hypothetical protein
LTILLGLINASTKQGLSISEEKLDTCAKTWFCERAGGEITEIGAGDETTCEMLTDCEPEEFLTITLIDFCC